MIEDRIRTIPWSEFDGIEREDLLVFYHPKTLADIEGLKTWLLRRREEGKFDCVDSWITMVALNRLTGHSPGFFSVYTLPPNQAVSVTGQEKINRKRKQVPPFRDISRIILEKTKKLLSDDVPQASKALFLTEKSSRTKDIQGNSVALTVTSPPFLNIVNYEADNWLRCWFLGINYGDVKITSHRKIEDWKAFVRATFEELARITRPSGHVAFEVGEVRKGTVCLDEHVIEAVEGLPFEVIGVLINRQSFTKTSNCWGVSNNWAGTNSNRVVILRRHGGS